MIGCWEGEVHYCCLKSYGIFYCSNVWWDHVPDANCTGVKGEHCSDEVIAMDVYDGTYTASMRRRWQVTQVSAPPCRRQTTLATSSECYGHVS